VHAVVFTAEELRQYMYCPRVIYYRRVLHLKPPPTVKMEHGAKLHSRKPKAGRGEKYLSLHLESRRLGLAAKLDVMEYESGKIAPVEVKTGRQPRHKVNGHILQAVAQAMLLEEAFQRPVEEAFILYKATGRRAKIKVTPELKRKVLETLAEMRKMLGEELIPEPPAERARCRDCEYRKLCSDV